MCTLNPALNQSGTPFGPDGCQVPIGNGICGETRTLDIVHEFKRLYEEKLQEIDASGGGDCLQEKVRLQQEWIGDLTCQNEMLVRAVEDLEREAAERVHMLEQKLQSSAKCLNEVIKKYREYDFTNEILEVPLRKMFHLENDQQNLLEFIRRARENNRWDLNGLKFFHIDPDEDLMKIQPNVGRIPFSNTTTEANGKLAAQESKIKELHTSLDHLKSFGDIPRIARDLGKKIQECEVLQKRMEEMQKTFDEEDTFKNNHLTQLKEDCKMLEEKVIHADEQVAFRDSIINDLRKEIKLLQEEVTQNEVAELNKTIQDLQDTLQRTKHLQEEEERVKDVEIDRLNTIVSELKRCLRNSEEKDTSKTQEIQHLNRVIKQLVGNLRQIEEKFESVGKVCRICKGRNKVGFSENVKVQTEPDEDQRDLCQQRDDLIKMQSEALSTLEYSVNSICCKETVDELNDALKKRDDVIRVQNETLSAIQQQLETTKHLQQEAELDKEKCLDEIKTLKNNVNELQCALEESSKRALDLQQAMKEKDEFIESQNKKNFALRRELDSLKAKLSELKSENEKSLDNMLTFQQCTCELADTFQCLESKSACVENALQKRDEIIKLQNDTLRSLQMELDSLKNQKTDDAPNCYGLNKLQQEKDAVIKLQSNLLNELQGQLDSLKVKHSVCESSEQEYLQEIRMLNSSLEKKNQIIKLRNDAVKSLELELRTLRDNECELNKEKTRRLDEIQHLKDEFNQLRLMSQDAEGRANNFQGAVDLYMNTINVLEASAEKYKIEINQQKATIANLQEALVIAKKELDMAKQKTEESVSAGWATRWFGSGDTESAVHDV